MMQLTTEFRAHMKRYGKYMITHVAITLALAILVVSVVRHTETKGYYVHPYHGQYAVYAATNSIIDPRVTKSLALETAVDVCNGLTEVIGENRVR